VLNGEASSCALSFSVSREPLPSSRAVVFQTRKKVIRVKDMWTTKAEKRTSEQAIIVEIRAAEGGEDATEIALEQVGIYVKYAARRRL
jgi:protein subunit release factor A